LLHKQVLLGFFCASLQKPSLTYIFHLPRIILYAFMTLAHGISDTKKGF